MSDAGPPLQTPSSLVQQVYNLAQFHIRHVALSRLRPHQSLPHLLCSLRLHIQPRQISLPTNRHDTRKHAPVLRRNEAETKRRNSRPHLPAVPPRSRHRIDDALFRLSKRRARQQALHAEEVSVEHRREECLVHDNLDGQRQRVRRVIEVVAQEHEPFVRWDAGDAANYQCSYAADGLVGVLGLAAIFLASFSIGSVLHGRTRYELRGKISQEVDCQGGEELCLEW